jgi:hypothetical protein
VCGGFRRGGDADGGRRLQVTKNRLTVTVD